MAYTPPSFNLLCDIWAGGAYSIPTSLGGPDFASVPCQLYVSVANLAQRPVGFWQDGWPYKEFRFSKDFLDSVNSLPIYWNFCWFNYPIGSGQWWRPGDQAWRHEGFPNQYGYATVDLYTGDGNLWIPANNIFQYPPIVVYSWPR